MDDFVGEVTCGLNQPPNYFPVNVAMNKGINKTFNDIIKSGIKPLNANKFKSLSEKRPLLIVGNHKNLPTLIFQTHFLLVLMEDLPRGQHLS